MGTTCLLMHFRKVAIGQHNVLLNTVVAVNRSEQDGFG